MENYLEQFLFFHNITGAVSESSGLIYGVPSFVMVEHSATNPLVNEIVYQCPWCFNFSDSSSLGKADLVVDVPVSTDFPAFGFTGTATKEGKKNFFWQNQNALAD